MFLKLSGISRRVFFICIDDTLSSLTEKINNRWAEWLDFGLVINEETRMNAADCIMWELNASSQVNSDCQVVTWSEQIVNAHLDSYRDRKALTRHPRFHLSHWRETPAHH